MTTERRPTVTVNLELPQGHVNLEAYAASYYGDRDMPLGSVQYHMDRDHEPVADEWDVRIVGDPADWIQQAHRYMTERPRKSLVDCLDTFRRWDETDSDTLERARKTAVHHTGLPTVQMGNMADGQWDWLREYLNEIDNVSIPESYSNEQEA